MTFAMLENKKFPKKPFETAFEKSQHDFNLRLFSGFMEIHQN